MPAPYLTTQEAEQRLLAYSVAGAPTEDELRLASDELDLLGGFVGLKHTEGQHRQFPRTINIRDDVDGEIPQAVKDWVALSAYQLQREDTPPVKSEKLDVISTTYTRGKKNRLDRLKKDLLRFYRGASAQGRIRIV